MGTHWRAQPCARECRAYQPVDTTAQVWETYKALPALERAYTDYDFALVAEILDLAERQAVDAARKGKGACVLCKCPCGRGATLQRRPLAGTGEVTLQRLLLAYEVVLPRHNVRPEEDIYYYRSVPCRAGQIAKRAYHVVPVLSRFLLKLSLDPGLDWWAKLRREMQGLGG